MTAFDLVRASRSARAIFEQGYESGFAAGVREGRRREEAVQAALQRQAVAVARATAAGVPYAELAERRGEPERAARQRALLAERGISR